MSIGFAILFLILSVSVLLVPLPQGTGRIRFFSLVFLALAGLSVVNGAVKYNDAGYCVHIRTIFGTESAKCNLGWYFAGWGDTTTYPHFITVANTNDPAASGSEVTPPYRVVMADQWAGDVTQTTRFGLPLDDARFLQMARDLRSPERLISTTLVPAVAASIDSVANLYTMEEYYAGGKRDQFKNEFYDAMTKGRPIIERVEEVHQSPDLNRETAPSDSPNVADTAELGSTERPIILTRKKLDSNGEPIRVSQPFAYYGITVSTAIIQSLDPDDVFEKRIQERKEAAAKRIIAKEKQLEEEAQRLLAISKAEREIADRQGAARVEQIQKTTEAETSKRLSLINAEQMRETARIAKQTSEINLEKARVDAESVKVAAEAAAYEKSAILEADGALVQKLDALVKVQTVWAQAFAQRAVPSTVFGGNGSGGTDSDVQTFMNLMTLNAAKQLQIDPAIGSKIKQ